MWGREDLQRSSSLKKEIEIEERRVERCGRREEWEEGAGITAVPLGIYCASITEGTTPSRIITSCTAKKHSAVQYSAVQCSAVRYSAVQYSAVQCSAVQCDAVQCGTVRYSAVQCSAVRYGSV
jgi:hypothetical protein